MKIKIIADKNIPYLRGVAEYFGEVTYLDGADFNNHTIKDADALIVRTVTNFGESILKNTNVKLICSATIGYDHIDTAYCDSHDIAWVNAPGCNSGSVQQYVISSLLVMAQTRGFSLKDKTIGIVGVGNVGKKVAKACQILGMKVLLNDPPRQKTENIDDFVSLETIKREADIITFHTPLTKEGEYRTYQLADYHFFSDLGRCPIIINSARGGIIDTMTIKKAIIEKTISGTIIDCWENEPHIDLEYMQLANIATPHIAGYSADGKANATRMSLQSVADFFNLDSSPIELIKEPLPKNPVIDLSQLDKDKRIEQAILCTYNPTSDFQRFIQTPQSFKDLRNNYPLRREYLVYSVKNATDEEAFILGQLGFHIIT